MCLLGTLRPGAFLIALALVLAPSVGRAQQPPGASVEPTPAAPRGEVLTFDVDVAHKAEYRIPVKYDPATGATLLVMMHGSNLSPPSGG